MNCAIVGCGCISPLHVKGICDAKGTLKAVCDISLDKAENLIKNNNLKNVNVYDSFLKMLDNEDLDVIHIATPHYLHVPMSIEALKRNINVLSEKPLCINPTEMTELKKIIEKSDKKFGICFQNKYLNETRFLKDYLADKKIVYVAANVIWARNKDYYNSANWRGTLFYEGGGVGINQAIHTLDLMLWLGTDRAKAVSAYTDNFHLKDVIEVEDTILAYIDYENYKGQFYATTAAYKDMPVEIIFQTESETIRLYGGEVFINGERKEIEKNGIIYGKECWGCGHSALIADFYNSIKQNIPFESDFYKAETTMKTLFAIYKSNGRKIIV